MAPAKKTSENNSWPPSTYWVSFEDYLKPKSCAKQPLILDNKNQKRRQLHLKLLEHPVLHDGPQAKYFHVKERVLNILPKELLKISCSQWKCHRILSFLQARNDKHICKRKSGFEMYCEMASIHGFQNFIGATTLQRVFWFLVLLTAVIMSGSFVLVSHLSHVERPTRLHSETTEYPIWGIPFPAITICNLNKISKLKAERLAKTFQNTITTNLTSNQMTNYFKLALFSTENIQADPSEYKILSNILKLNNFPLQQLLQEISPDCETELLQCSFQGNDMRCKYLFQPIQTSFGQCCSFNYGVQGKKKLFSISKCGYVNGLTVLLDPHSHDYKASTVSTTGFHILAHDVYEFPDEGTADQRIITTSTFNNIRFCPQQTYATEHIRSLEIKARKCYLAHERKLYHFKAYSLGNCLAECRSLMFFEKCNCALPYRPRMSNWTLCGLDDVQCYLKYKHVLLSTSKHSDEKEFICDCWPSCDVNQYNNIMESGQFSRQYSLTEKRLHKSSTNTSHHILLRVYVSEPNMDRFRFDASENWLVFLGTFGGIVGLHMGYSFLSGFELVFFAFVRPVRNWWIKRRIAERTKRRRREEENTKNFNN